MSSPPHYGSSRTTGGSTRGHAVGNVFNFADAGDNNDTAVGNVLILLMQVMMMILQFQELEESMSIIHQWIPIESSLSVFSRLMFNSLWHLFSSLLLQSGLLLKVCDCYAYTLLFIIISS